MSAERRAELLQFFAADAAIQEMFEDRRWRWSGCMEEKNKAVGIQITDEMFALWKRKQRERRPRKSAA